MKKDKDGYIVYIYGVRITGVHTLEQLKDFKEQTQEWKKDKEKDKRIIRGLLVNAFKEMKAAATRNQARK